VPLPAIPPCPAAPAPPPVEPPAPLAPITLPSQAVPAITSHEANANESGQAMDLVMRFPFRSDADRIINPQGPQGASPIVIGSTLRRAAQSRIIKELRPERDSKLSDALRNLREKRDKTDLDPGPRSHDHPVKQSR
jgi:hypothetical protein